MPRTLVPLRSGSRTPCPSLPHGRVCGYVLPRSLLRLHVASLLPSVETRLSRASVAATSVIGTVPGPKLITQHAAACDSLLASGLPVHHRQSHQRENLTYLLWANGRCVSLIEKSCARCVKASRPAGGTSSPGPGHFRGEDRQPIAFGLGWRGWRRSSARGGQRAIRTAWTNLAHGQSDLISCLPRGERGSMTDGNPQFVENATRPASFHRPHVLRLSRSAAPSLVMLVGVAKATRIRSRRGPLAR
jgi:hypothetical protein